MTAVEHTVRTVHLRALREAVRVTVQRMRRSLDMPATSETDAIIAEALADVAQDHRVRRDADVDLSLNDREDAAERGREICEAGVAWLTGRASR